MPSVDHHSYGRNDKDMTISATGARRGRQLIAEAFDRRVLLADECDVEAVCYVQARCVSVGIFDNWERDGDRLTRRQVGGSPRRSDTLFRT
jgi:hypothetical protein